nr:hypothetical protein [Pseudomonas sp. Bi70]
MDIGVDLGAAGDQVELVDVAGIEAGAFDGDVAAVDVEALEATVLNLRCTGAQGRARGVDEPAAIAGDAMGVGDDDMGALPGHFRVALELAAVATGHLVEDDARGTAFEIRVAIDVAAQLARHESLGAIVEDQPLLADVVVGELVVRQAAAIGRGDIHHRHAIAGLADAGVATGSGVDCQLGSDGAHRIEQHDADEDAGDGTVQGAANVHVDNSVTR